MTLVRRKLFDVPDFPGWPDLFDDKLRVEEKRDGDDLVIRAEVPGVEPKDVDVSVHDGVLTVKVEREEKSETEEEGRFRSEFRYGSFARSIVLPTGVDEDAITADCTNGVVEVRVPAGAAPSPTVRKIDVGRG
jgi:HSP20 family protein